MGPSMPGHSQVSLSSLPLESRTSTEGNEERKFPPQLEFLASVTSQDTDTLSHPAQICTLLSTALLNKPPSPTANTLYNRIANPDSSSSSAFLNDSRYNSHSSTFTRIKLTTARPISCFHKSEPTLFARIIHCSLHVQRSHFTKATLKCNTEHFLLQHFIYSPSCKENIEY